MALARQRSAWPTNKLAVAAAIAPAATEVWSAVMSANHPELSGPAVSILVGALASLVVGWFIPDRANVPK